VAKVSSVVGKLGAILVGLALGLGALEIGLRIAPGAISPRLLILFEPGLRERIAAGTYPVGRDFVHVARDDQGPPLRVWKPYKPIVSIDASGEPRQTDEAGFCNPRGSYAERESIDVIAIGDSFTFCHGVEATDAWPYVLGERAGLSSYNLGRGGSGLYEYLQLLKHFGLAKRPRVVVMNVYAGNDLRDAAYYAEYRDALVATGEPPRDELQPAVPWLTHGAVGRHSYAFNFLGAFVTRAAARSRDPDGRSGIDFRYTLELEDGPVPFNVENRDRDEVVFARRLADRQVSLELWEPALRTFVELARDHGFTPVVAYTPSAHAAHGDRTRFHDGSLEPELAAFGAAQRAFLAAKAAELGYVFHDLTPDLRAAAARSTSNALLYDPESVHLTPDGNAVVAESLAALLESRAAATRPR
jgi:hypothetical protein